MSRSSRIVIVFVASMLVVTGAYGQEESESFTQRISRFGRNLFNRAPKEQLTEDPYEAPPRAREGSAMPREPFSADAVRGQRFSDPQESPRRTTQPAPASSAAPQAPQRRAPRAETQSAQAPPPVQSSRRTAQPGYAPAGPESVGEVRPPRRPVQVEPDGVAPDSLDDLPSSPPTSTTIESRDAPRRSLQQRLDDARRYTPEPQAAPATSAAATPARPPRVEPAAPFARTARVPESAPAVAEAAVAKNPHVIISQQSPSLTLETVGPEKIRVGAVAAYQIVIRNTGAIDADEVLVAIKLPDGAELANTHASEGTTHPGATSDGGATLEWHIPLLRTQSKAELAVRLIPHKSRSFDLAVNWTSAPIVSQTSIEVQEPKLVMTLAGPEEVFFGERELYKLTLSNPGNGDAENVVVRLLPTSPGDGEVVSHQVGVLAAGENKVVELELTARQSGNLRLKAEATGDGGLQAAVDEEVVVRRANIQVAVDGPPLLYAGTIGAYQVTVANPGNAVAKNVQIAAVLPTGANFVSATEGGQYSREQGRVVWNTTNLRPGAQWTGSIQCELAQPGSNTLQLIGTAEGDLRHVATLDTEVEALADLTLTVQDPQGPVPVGQDTYYEIRIHNRGTKAADGVEVVAFFSPGIEPIEVEGGEHEIGPGQIAMAPIASLTPGEERIFKIRARAHRGGNHVFRAEVQCPTLETKLAAEETTRFYGIDVPNDAADSQPASAAAPDATESAQDSAPADEEATAEAGSAAESVEPQTADEAAPAPAGESTP
ncbi:MAG: DUF11 domain-containing protein [Pirellulales bacterium]|nr:DUF11 domain-containing protein [Pirellulales bacterium]